MTVIEEIAAERKRQIEVEGWTLEHDDMHEDGELAKAAACYAAPEYQYQSNGRVDYSLPIGWPFSWPREWWKPKDRRRDLIRAAALTRLQDRVKELNQCCHEFNDALGQKIAQLSQKDEEIERIVAEAIEWRDKFQAATQREAALKQRIKEALDYYSLDLHPDANIMASILKRKGE